MRLLILYPKTLLLLMTLVLGSHAITAAQAVTLNFSAFLTLGTCTFSLDKSTLKLGTISLRELQPSTIVAAQPFTLHVQDCTGTDASLTPVVNITGEGSIQDGRWLFRSPDSVATGMGVMLVKTTVPPAYSATEVRDGDDIVLAAMGNDPVNQDMTFYAGASCGNTSCTALQTGSLTARVLFNLAYR